MPQQFLIYIYRIISRHNSPKRIFSFITMAPFTFYDLSARGQGFDYNFSPNTWRTRMLLNYKGLEYEIKHLTFLEIKQVIPTLSPDIATQVPVLVDHNTNTTIQDSWKIAQYLEKTYPNPSCFHGQPTLHQFVQFNIEQAMASHIIALLVVNNYRLHDEENKAYYKETREKRYGVKLEEFCGDRNARIANVKTWLVPYHRVLEQGNLYFSTPDKVGYADFLLASLFLFVRGLLPQNEVDEILFQFDDDLLKDWHSRMLVYMDNWKPAHGL